MTNEDCKRCWGSGKIANTAKGEPWPCWANLPYANATALMLGLVKPVDCPDCAGSGKGPEVFKAAFVERRLSADTPLCGACKDEGWCHDDEWNGDVVRCDVCCKYATNQLALVAHNAVCDCGKPIAALT